MLITLFLIPIYIISSVITIIALHKISGEINNNDITIASFPLINTIIAIMSLIVLTCFILGYPLRYTIKKLTGVK